jgi:hypothetical protein
MIRFCEHEGRKEKNIITLCDKNGELPQLISSLSPSIDINILHEYVGAQIVNCEMIK